ncbi:RAB11-binding protein RELCH-like [Dama dama]
MNLLPLEVVSSWLRHYSFVAASWNTRVHPPGRAVSPLLPQLIEIVGKINVTSTACVHEFSRFFWHLCWTFGQIFTNTKVKPQFQEILRLSEENIDSSAGNGVLTKANVPIYATGVLMCYIQEEDRKLLIGFLEDVMTLLSLSHAPLDSLKASFVELV